MLAAGQVLTLGAGAYRLHEQLAGSAYGLVWRAQGPGADVALKLINREQMQRALPGQRERWIASADNEISFLRSLEPWDERHIVRLLDSGAHDGLPVLALELMDGDLGKHVARERSAGRAIPFPGIVDWLAQINQALATVHQYGWHYLDLKPANVLLNDATGSVKLADFGTSRARAAPSPATYAGTASWQAPEQFFPTPQQTYDSDQRSDYFALGAMFYYLVTGGLPLRFCSACGKAYREFQADGAAHMLERHGGVPATLRPDEAALFTHRIARQGYDAEPALVLLRALLAPERAGRPQHALQVSRMLGAIGVASVAPEGLQ
jgi:serine/threonine protein kinase